MYLLLHSVDSDAIEYNLLRILPIVLKMFLQYLRILILVSEYPHYDQIKIMLECQIHLVSLLSFFGSLLISIFPDHLPAY